MDATYEKRNLQNACWTEKDNIKNKIARGVIETKLALRLISDNIGETNWLIVDSVNNVV